MSKKILKHHSRYRQPRWETECSPGVFLLEGPSNFSRYAGMDALQEQLADSRHSLGMIDFEGGPCYFVGDIYYPGPENQRGLPAPRKIIGLYELPSDKSGYCLFRIVTKEQSMQDQLHSSVHKLRKNLDVSLKDLLEKLSHLEHEQWMEWAKTLMEKEPGLTPDRVARWKQYMIPYAELPEDVKEFDRIWGRKILAAFSESAALDMLDGIAGENERLQAEYQELVKDFESLKEEYSHAVEELEQINAKLQTTLNTLQEDVKKLFTAQVDKQALLRYLAPEKE